MSARDDTPIAARSAGKFDHQAAMLSYVRARGTAPEDDILSACQAAEEAHVELHGDDSTDGADAPLILFFLVTAKRLRWRARPGGDPMNTPLLYSLTAREQRRGRP